MRNIATEQVVDAVVKLPYGDTPGEGRYSPGECIGAEKKCVREFAPIRSTSAPKLRRARQPHRA